MDWNQVSAKTKLRTTTWNSIPGFAGQLLINTPSISSQNNSDSVFSHCLSVLLDSVSPLQKRFSPRAHFLLGCHQEAQYLVIHMEDNFDLTGSCITLPFPFFGSPSTCPFLYCSWRSRGKNTEVVCDSLLQWTTFCQNSPMTHLS